MVIAVVEQTLVDLERPAIVEDTEREEWLYVVLPVLYGGEG
jgi:hypothetical protein